MNEGMNLYYIVVKLRQETMNEWMYLCYIIVKLRQETINVLYDSFFNFFTDSLTRPKKPHLKYAVWKLT